MMSFKKAEFWIFLNFDETQFINSAFHIFMYLRNSHLIQVNKIFTYTFNFHIQVCDPLCVNFYIQSEVNVEVHFILYEC